MTTSLTTDLPDADQVKAMLGYDPATAKACEDAYRRGFHRGLEIREPRRTIRQAIAALLELREVLAAVEALATLDAGVSDASRLPDHVAVEVRTWVNGMKDEAERLIALVAPYVPERQRRPKRTA